MEAQLQELAKMVTAQRLLIQELTEKLRIVEEANAKMATTKRDATQDVETDPTTPRRRVPVEELPTSRFVPIFRGAEDDISGEDWLRRLEAEMERIGVTDDGEKVRLAVSYIHTERGPARKIAQASGIHGAPWEAFKGLVCVQFPTRERTWDQLMRDGARYREESFEDWMRSERVVVMNCAMTLEWPLEGHDLVIGFAMNSLQDTMVGRATSVFAKDGTWDFDRLREISYPQVMAAIREWVEDNEHIDAYFQSTLPSHTI